MSEERKRILEIATKLQQKMLTDDDEYRTNFNDDEKCGWLLGVDDYYQDFKDYIDSLYP